MTPTDRLTALLLASAAVWERLAIAFDNDRWRRAAEWRREAARALEGR